jgi:hypothetical protein
MNSKTIWLILALLFPLQLFPQADDNCDTFLGSINDPDNDCAPCVNKMEQMLGPVLLHKRKKDSQRSLNNFIERYLENEQPKVDDLIDKQGDIDRVLKEWGINNLNGGPSVEDLAYLQNTIEDMIAYAKRYPNLESWYNEWVNKFEEIIKLLKEAENFKDRAKKLKEEVENGKYQSLRDIKFDCCPGAIENGDFPEDQLNVVEDFMNDLENFYNDMYNYRSKLADEIAILTELLKAILKDRSSEEAETTKRRDELANGIIGFLVSKLQQGMQTGIEQLLESQGVDLSPDQKKAIEAFSAVASSNIGAAASGGGAGGMSAESIGIIAENAIGDMSENDSKALGAIANAVWSEAAGQAIQAAFANVAQGPLGKFLTQGLQGAALPIAILDKMLTIPFYLWEDMNLNILRGAFDRVILGLLKGIKLTDNTADDLLSKPFYSYLDQLKAPNNRAIVICLETEEYPEDMTRAEMVRKLYAAAFPGQRVKLLSENDHFEVKKEEGKSYLLYKLENRIRFKVRFDCYCGQIKKPIYHSLPPVITPGPVISTGESIGPVGELDLTNPTDQNVKFTIDPGLITSHGKYQLYVIVEQIEVTIGPFESIKLPIIAICANDNLPPVPEGSEMPPKDTWIPLDPNKEPPDVSIEPTIKINIVNDPETALPYIHQAAERINDTVDRLSAEGELPKTPLSSNPENEKNSLKQQAFWDYTTRIQGRPSREDAFKTNAQEQLEETLGKPISDLPEKTQEQLGEGLTIIWETISFVGGEAKVFAEEKTCPCPPCTIEPIVLRYAESGVIIEADSIPWGLELREDSMKLYREILAEIPEITNPCPAECEGSQTVEMRVIPDMLSKNPVNTNWTNENLVVPVTSKGKLQFELRYTCSCSGKLCDEQVFSKNLVLTESNDCCSEIRSRSNGALFFSLGQGDFIRITGNQMRVYSNSSDRIFDFDFNLEALFCNLTSDQVLGIFKQMGSQDSSDGNIEEQLNSAGISLGHSSNLSSGDPHYTFSFSQTIDGEEVHVAFTLDEEKCLFDAQILLGDQLAEYPGPSFLNSDELPELMETINNALIFGNITPAVFLNRMMHYYLQIIKGKEQFEIFNDDQWKAIMQSAVRSMMQKENDAANKEELQNLFDRIVSVDSTSEEIIKAMMEVLNG